MAARTNQTINPSTGEVIETYELMSNDDMLQVLDKAHAAYEQWRDTSIEERSRILYDVANRLRDNKDEYADIMAREMGKPIAEGLEEIEGCAGICEYEAAHAPELLADEKRKTSAGEGLIAYEPMGVIFGIQPWNFPFYQIIRYTAANLMAGNAVLLKHAPNVWGSALAVEKLMQATDLPDDLFRVLLIDEDQCSLLMEQDKVQGVTFTGSPRGGSSVASQAAKQLKKTVIELGGNDAYLVLDDADLEQAVKCCVEGRMGNAGQTCVAAKRFIVADSLYEQFRDRLLERMRDIQYGDPRDSNTQIGPIAREDLRETLHSIVKKAIDGGAKCLIGGDIPDGPGFFYPATVLEGPYPGEPGYDEEMFGPVASLLRAKDEQEAIDLANNSRYGLGGGVFSQDEERAYRVARQIYTGMVNLNGYAAALAEVPFGGAKGSGYGREHGGFGIREFVNVKAIVNHNG